MPNAYNSRGRRAFTLIELLVVVGIIALLVALLVPSLIAAQRSAKRVACQANLRQLAVAWHGYLHESGDRFLRGAMANMTYGGKQVYESPPSGPHEPSRNGPKPLNKHVGMPLIVYSGAEVFHCPGDSGGSSASYFDYYGASYRTNRILIGPLDLPISPLDPCRDLMEEINRRIPSLTRSQIRNESMLLLMGDAGWDQAWNVALKGTPAEWHGRPGMHNIAFMDGHVQFLQILRGQHVTASYTVIPFSDLIDDALACQKTGPGS